MHGVRAARGRQLPIPNEARPRARQLVGLQGPAALEVRHLRHRAGAKLNSAWNA